MPDFQRLTKLIVKHALDELRSYLYANRESIRGYAVGKRSRHRARPTVGSHR
jgi:hypothetical protein